jgi:hypothetical protein
MDLDHFVDHLRQQFLLAAEAFGDETLNVAERLVTLLDSSVQMAMLGVLSVAADELTRDLAPDSVELRLRGMSPSFVVTRAAGGPEHDEPSLNAPDHAAVQPPTSDDSTPARINFRPPEHLKVRIDEAALRAGMSVNAWLVRVVTAALATPPERPERGPRPGKRYRGWVH